MTTAAACLHGRRQERQSLLASSFRFMVTFARVSGAISSCAIVTECDEKKEGGVTAAFPHNQEILRVQPKVSGIRPVWMPVRVS